MVEVDPLAVLAFIAVMNEIRFVDTTLRSGPPSLWALGMTTGAMLDESLLRKLVFAVDG